jgi:hypothetical protein
MVEEEDEDKRETVKNKGDPVRPSPSGDLHDSVTYDRPEGSSWDARHLEDSDDKAPIFSRDHFRSSRPSKLLAC